MWWRCLEEADRHDLGPKTDQLLPETRCPGVPSANLHLLRETVRRNDGAADERTRLELAHDRERNPHALRYPGR
jgi:hypothetical protein